MLLALGEELGELLGRRHLDHGVGELGILDLGLRLEVVGRQDKVGAVQVAAGRDAGREEALVPRRVLLLLVGRLLLGGGDGLVDGELRLGLDLGGDGDDGLDDLVALGVHLHRPRLLLVLDRHLLHLELLVELDLGARRLLLGLLHDRLEPGLLVLDPLGRLDDAAARTRRRLVARRLGDERQRCVLRRRGDGRRGVRRARPLPVLPGDLGRPMRPRPLLHLGRAHGLARKLLRSCCRSSRRLRLALRRKGDRRPLTAEHGAPSRPPALDVLARVLDARRVERDDEGGEHEDDEGSSRGAGAPRGGAVAGRGVRAEEGG